MRVEGLGDTGPEHHKKPSGNKDKCKSTGPNSGPDCADLGQLLGIWPSLSADVRRAILQLARAAASPTGLGRPAAKFKSVVKTTASTRGEE